jgi:hypothetical protein
MNKQLRTPTNPSTLKSVGAFDAYIQDEQEHKAREKYAAFVAECRRDLSPVEAECGGIISFEEWCAWKEVNAHA